MHEKIFASPVMDTDFFLSEIRPEYLTVCYMEEYCSTSKEFEKIAETFKEAIKIWARCDGIKHEGSDCPSKFSGQLSEDKQRRSGFLIEEPEKFRAPIWISRLLTYNEPKGAEIDESDDSDLEWKGRSNERAGAVCRLSNLLGL